MNTKFKSVTVRIESSLYDGLKIEADKKGITVSDVVRSRIVETKQEERVDESDLTFILSNILDKIAYCEQIEKNNSRALRSLLKGSGMTNILLDAIIPQVLGENNTTKQSLIDFGANIGENKANELGLEN